MAFEEFMSFFTTALFFNLCLNPPYLDQVGKDYLLCDYNRDGDSYRSPWTNAYDPPLDDGAMPSDRLRQLEIDANAAFDQYREMYFEGGVSSVYLWDLVSWYH